MIRSYQFTTQGKLQSKDLQPTAMAAVLNDPKFFLWVDLEKATPEESRTILEDVFHFHPLSIEDCITVSPFPKVEEYNPGPDDKFAPYLFVVLHAVDYNRQDGIFSTSDLDF